MVTALDKNWHPECFCCVKCSRTFGDEGTYKTPSLWLHKRVFWLAESRTISTCTTPLINSRICMCGLVTSLQSCMQFWDLEHFLCPSLRVSWPWGTAVLSAVFSGAVCVAMWRLLSAHRGELHLCPQCPLAPTVLCLQGKLTRVHYAKPYPVYLLLRPSYTNIQYN